MTTKGEWRDGKLVSQDYQVAYKPEDWRIKPEEPVYEWQWVMFSEKYNKHYMTDRFYANKWEILSNRDGWVKYEPSKRIRR